METSIFTSEWKEYKLKTKYVTARQWREGVEIEGVSENPFNNDAMKNMWFMRVSNNTDRWIRLVSGDWIVKFDFENGFVCPEALFSEIFMEES